MDAGKLNEIAMRRVCLECGSEFLTDGEGTALGKYADHSLKHQATVGQWHEAYKKIQAAKKRNGVSTGTERV